MFLSEESSMRFLRIDAIPSDLVCVCERARDDSSLRKNRIDAIFLPRDRSIKKTRMGLRSAVTRNFSRRFQTVWGLLIIMSVWPSYGLRRS